MGGMFRHVLSVSRSVGSVIVDSPVTPAVERPPSGRGLVLDVYLGDRLQRCSNRVRVEGRLQELTFTSRGLKRCDILVCQIGDVGMAPRAVVDYDRTSGCDKFGDVEWESWVVAAGSWTGVAIRTGGLSIDD